MPYIVEADRQVDTGLACLTMLMGFLGLPADPEQIRHQFGKPGKPLDSTDLLRAAKRLGLKVRAVSAKWSRLARTPLPAIAEHRDGRWFLIAKVASDKALIHDPLEQRPLALPRAQFEQAWTGRRFC